MTTTAWPAGFRWGCATSAYQIEGALHDGGRGESIWDRFCATPGRIAGGDDAHTACDHWRRWPEDVALLAGLGVNAYRFSVGWTRVQPSGRGAPLAAGLDGYERLVDALLAHGIEPWITLYHWDLPQALQDEGGWLVRSTGERFAEFGALVAARLGDRVRHWMTLNESFEHTVFGHALGTHAPGLALGLDALAVGHQLLRAHGLALQALRAVLPADAQLGIAQSIAPPRPASDRPEDHEAAALLDLLQHGQHIEPLLTGRYADELLAFGLDERVVQPGDLALIGQPIDFLGLNFYNATTVQATPPGAAVPIAEAEPPAGAERTAMGWPVTPEAFTDALLGLRARHGARLPPLVITENGAAFDDVLQADGTVDDAPRVRYLQRHLDALAAALAAGVDVRGYFAWSLLDNFEWAEGRQRRFGLVHVDDATQRRRPKASYHHYRKWIAAAR